MTTLLKKFIPILIISLAMILVVGSAQASDLNPEIQVQESWVDYQFEVGIPMIVKAGTKLQAGSLPQYVSMLIYRVIFPASGILGFIMILWAGVEYMVAGGSVEHQKAAQQRIIDALAGLLLLFAFWIILNTINPNILKLPDIGLVMGQYLGLSNTAAGRLGTLIDKQAVWGIRDDYQWDGTYPQGANYGGTRKDLLDKDKGKCIDPYENSSNPDGNCLDKVKSEGGGWADCVTIDDNLITYLSAILDPTFSQTCPDGKTYTTAEYLTDCNFIVGPFVSDHNYCNNPDSKHKDGKAFDLEADGDRDSVGGKPICAQRLAQLFCLTRCGQSKYITNPPLPDFYVLYECVDGDPARSHLHFELLD
jgi:hypothetical protein